MSLSGKHTCGVERLILVLLLVVLAVSLGWLFMPRAAEPVPYVTAGSGPTVAKLQFDAPELKAVPRGSNLLFSSELRVAAIGSAYPIPYAAEICPFTQMPQPSLDQLDRDGDGLTDDWEIKYGLDKFNAADALLDSDGDGFVEREEFEEKTDPTDPQSHPPYALKLRLVKLNEETFPLIFQGVSQVEDGQNIFQINTSADGLTHFLPLGEGVKGIVLRRYLPADGERGDRLVVQRRAAEIVLPLGEVVADPESHAELINILDRTIEIVTMGTLLPLCNDVYTVVGVYSDRVMVKLHGTGEVYSIGRLTEEERKLLF